MVEIDDLIIKASRIDETRFRTPNELKEERLKSGSYRLKRAFKLNFFNRKVTKSLEEVASIFYKLNIVSSIEEGKTVVPSFTGVARIRVEGNGWFSLSDKYIYFTKVENSKRDEKYKIELSDQRNSYP